MDVYLKAIVTFSAIILIASCTSSTNPPVAANDSVATNAITSASSSSVPVNTDSIPNTTPIVIDSSVYVEVVNAFDATGEYYISIFSLPHREHENYFEILSGKTDSVIHKDIESKRSRIPMNIASEYFNLSGLERISVYNDGQHQTDASLVRVELFDDLIEGKFIAVFKPDQFIRLNWNEAYCVSSRENSETSEELSFEPLEDSTLTKNLLNTFEFDAANVWHAVHVKTMPGDVIYSGLTFATGSILIETTGDRSTIVKTIGENCSIRQITPVHLVINDKPVLLLHMAVNETDMYWTSLAVYSGTEYQLREGNRLGGRVHL